MQTEKIVGSDIKPGIRLGRNKETSELKEKRCMKKQNVENDIMQIIKNKV